MKNTYWFRHFLICDRFAKNICEGFDIDNFARLILEEEEGCSANYQMTCFFWAIDKSICSISENVPMEVFENLEEEDNVTMEELSKLTKKELAHYFNIFCTPEYIKFG